jgi:hypothetical protein
MVIPFITRDIQEIATSQSWKYPDTARSAVLEANHLAIGLWSLYV